MRSSFHLAVVFLFITLLAACGGSSTTPPPDDFDTGDGFETAAPETGEDSAPPMETGGDDTAPTETGDDTADADAADAMDSAETASLLPTLSISDVTIAEGNSGTTDATFTVTLSSASTKSVTVAYATLDDSATGGVDYVASAGTITFAPGTTTQSVKVAISGDTLDEDDELFRVKLSSPTEATLAADEGTGTITDDDAVPTLSIDDVSVVEGHTGTGTAKLTVTLSGASGLPVTVAFTTADGTATTAGSDYASSSGTLTFLPGTTTQTISVIYNSDATYEVNETLTVTLSAPVNATLARASGTVTIEDDDTAPTLSINDVSVLEGNSGTSSANFTVSLSAISGRTTTVSYTTSDGTASASTDYVAVPPTTLTFAPGEKTKTVAITINGDTGAEPIETFQVTLSAPTNATVAKAVGTGTIANDDSGAPILSISDVTVVEGSSGTSVMTFTVTASRAPASGETYTVVYATGDGTASPPDYVPASGVLTFNPGETSKTISVTINADTQYELNETLSVTLSSATTAILGNSIGTGTITNDDAMPTVSIGNASVAEGASGARSLDFTVSLSAAAGVPVAVSYASSDGTAKNAGSASTGGSDYVASSGTVVFPPGSTSRVVSVAVNGDTLNEADETMTMTLSSPASATLGAATGAGTILNDDALPTVSIAGASGTEGNSGTTPLAFAVTLSAPSGRTVTVAYATANGTALAGTDYVASSGSVTFAAGQTTQSVNIQVNGDTAGEPNETFSVTLSAPTNATIATGTANGVIFNDDGSAPLLNINNTSVDEGNSGAKNVTFTVTLSAAATMAVTVDYATANGTAVAGADYTTSTGTLTLAAGETSKTFTIPVLGDTLDEDAETFVVNLSNPINAAIADGQGTATINDDDAGPTLTISDTTVTEGNTGTTTTATLTVSLSTASGRTVTVNYATADGSAVTSGVAASGGRDYNAASGTVTFAPGETAKTITLAVVGDATDEADAESFSVALSGATNGTIADATGVVTITDDDAPPTLTIADYSDTEGGSLLGGSKSFPVTVTLSSTSGRTVTVQYATANGTATSGSDYVSTSGTVTFAPGETTKTITVTVLGNITAEPNETFTVNLSAATNATIADASATVTIVNDD